MVPTPKDNADADGSSHGISFIYNKHITSSARHSASHRCYSRWLKNLFSRFCWPWLTSSDWPQNSISSSRCYSPSILKISYPSEVPSSTFSVKLLTDNWDSYLPRPDAYWGNAQVLSSNHVHLSLACEVPMLVRQTCNLHCYSRSQQYTSLQICLQNST